MTDKNREEKQRGKIKKVDPSKKVDFGGGISIVGNVDGSAIVGGSVHASNIAGGTVNIYNVYQEKDDLIEYMMDALDRENLSPGKKSDAIELIERVQIEIDLQDNDVDEKMLNFLLRSIRTISLPIFETLVKKILTQENISTQTKRLVKGLL